MSILVDVPPLHAAIWEGNIDAIRQILQEASSSSSSNNSNNNISSSSNEEDGGSSSPLKRVLETKDAHGNSALHLAVRLVQPAQRAIVQLLLVR